MDLWTETSAAVLTVKTFFPECIMKTNIFCRNLKPIICVDLLIKIIKNLGFSHTDEHKEFMLKGLIKLNEYHSTNLIPSNLFVKSDKIVFQL